MELAEYIAQLTSDVQAEAQMFQTSVEEAFFVQLADKLIESEVLADYTIGYFKKNGRSNRIIEFNGYGYDEADGTFNIFVVDTLDDLEATLTNTDLEVLIARAEELVHTAFEAKFTAWEESSKGYEAASQIYRLLQNRSRLDTELDLKKIRIFIFTNKKLSKVFKNKKRANILEIPVEYSVYDATRLYDMAKAGFEKEQVDILLEDYGMEGLYAIPTAEKEGEFKSYLASIPGKVLADIYLEKGTQILEGNVRAFLSVRGKVNKGIRQTILEAPEKFFILNNGITVTSNGIETKVTDTGLLITKIDHLQIVNGGQTTASLANAVVKEKVDLSRVQVMMKLSVLANHEVSEKLVPEISRASNSQNKVDEADFFSNHPYHVKIQELSERNLAPAVEGNQYQTVWFYERVRGQYTVEQMKLTAAGAKAWQLKHPKNQVIKKTDLAKYLMTYEGFPHEASKGAQAVMKKFSSVIQGTNGDAGLWEKDFLTINANYFKEAIAKAILFKELEKLVSGLDWYKEIKAYRANIVTYTIAILSEYAKKQKKSIDLKKIWNLQHMHEQLKKQCIVTSEEVYEFLTRDDRMTQNVTEWAKREECWKRAKKEKWKILPIFEESLVEIVKEKKSELTDSTVDAMEFVLEKDAMFWQELLTWGKKMLYINLAEQAYLEAAMKIHTMGEIPTDRQFAAIVKVYNDLVQRGFTE